MPDRGNTVGNALAKMVPQNVLPHNNKIMETLQIEESQNLNLGFSF